MITRIHFISGLPRSGSTLLSALLRQNPRFWAGISSPLAAACRQLHHQMSNGEFSIFFDEGRRVDMLRGLFEAYYSKESPDRVIFDTNRTWTGRVPLLSALYPRCRIICCVRDVGWILDSLERLRAKNPLYVSKIFTAENSLTVYTRAESLMNADRGLVGQAWSTLREAWFSEQAERLIVIPYESLVQRPERTLRKLYEELGETPFEHDFNQVSYQEPDYDALLGTPGLHTVRPVVSYQERELCIPPDLHAKYANTNFWSKPELNPRAVRIL
jgi:sulfotransferase